MLTHINTHAHTQTHTHTHCGGRGHNIDCDVAVNPLAYWAIIDEVYAKITLYYIQVTNQNITRDNA